MDDSQPEKQRIIIIIQFFIIALDLTVSYLGKVQYFDKQKEKCEGRLTNIIKAYILFFALFLVLTTELLIFEILKLVYGWTDKTKAYETNQAITLLLSLLLDSILESFFFCFALVMKQVEIQLELMNTSLQVIMRKIRFYQMIAFVMVSCYMLVKILDIFITLSKYEWPDTAILHYF